MENIHGLGERPYHKADTDVAPVLPFIVMFMRMVVLTIKALILCIPDVLMWVVRLFKPTKPKEIKGQVALVTGGANGLGQAISYRLAKEGCIIAVCDLDLNNGLKTANEIIAGGGKAKAYKVNISVYEEVCKVVDEIKKDLGPIDILINNAGILPAMSLREGSPQDIKDILQTNIFGNFWTTRLCYNDMLSRKCGHIVGISSIFGIMGSGRAIAYCTSKFAVTGFMDALSDEVWMDQAQDYIHTTIVHPFFICTRKELYENVVARQKTMFQNIPFLRAEKVAEATVNAILTNKVSVTVPWGFILIFKMFSSLPLVLRERFRAAGSFDNSKKYV